MPERFEIYIVYKRRYINSLPFLSCRTCVHLYTPVQVMIVIIVIFLVCQTPAFVNQLVYVIGVPDACGQPYYYYYHASNIVVSANSAVNFVVYCVFRRHFRRRLREFCSCAGERREHSPRDSFATVREPWPPKMKASITEPSPPTPPTSSRYTTHHVKAGIVQLVLERGSPGST